MESVCHGLLTDDQYFLLSFIMGTYFGPDLKNERHHKSALQRHMENLPLYNADDLADSQMKIISMESVYYYILRNAETSFAVNQLVLVQFIHGNLCFPVEGCTESYPKFKELFPPTLHGVLQHNFQCDTILNIVFIDNPDISYINPMDVARFIKLSKLENVHLDRESAMLHIFVKNSALYKVKVEQTFQLGDVLHQVNGQYENRFRVKDTHPGPNFFSDSTIHLTGSLHKASPLSHGSVVESAANDDRWKEDLYPGTIFLPSCPSTKDEWSNIVGSIKSGYAVTGSASRQRVGPVVGLMDIGESEDSYLFRVSLPGVRRDEKEFSCEVESNGKVLIKGVTVTGERTVSKFSRAFEMQTQNLCPPGPFSISFKLPGPVDPHQFHGTFATDGILEGLALKAKAKRF